MEGIITDLNKYINKKIMRIILLILAKNINILQKISNFFTYVHFLKGKNLRGDTAIVFDLPVYSRIEMYKGFLLP